MNKFMAAAAVLLVSTGMATADVGGQSTTITTTTSTAIPTPTAKTGIDGSLSSRRSFDSRAYNESVDGYTGTSGRLQDRKGNGTQVQQRVATTTGTTVIVDTAGTVPQPTMPQTSVIVQDGTSARINQNHGTMTMHTGINARTNAPAVVVVQP